MSAPASDTAVAAAFVVLKGGLTVPLAALQLAWSLEDRGATFAVEGGDLIIDGRCGLLTEADQAVIRQWKRHLMAIATYEAPEVVE